MRREGDAIFSLQRFFAGFLPEPWDIRTTLESGQPPERPFALIEAAGNAETTGAPAAQDIVLPLVANLFLEKGDTREAATAAALDLREEVWQAVKWGADPKRLTTDRIPLYAYEPRIAQHRFKVQADTGTFTITIAGHETDPLPAAATGDDIAAAIELALGAGGVELDAGDVVAQQRGIGLADIFYAGTLSGQDFGEPEIDGAGLIGTGLVATAQLLLSGAAVPWRGPSDYMRVTSFAQNTIPDQADPALVMVAVDLRLTFARGGPLPLDRKMLQRVNATVSSGSEA